MRNTQCVRLAKVIGARDVNSAGMSILVIVEHIPTVIKLEVPVTRALTVKGYGYECKGETND